jgi:hypothetical protein
MKYGRALRGPIWEQEGISKPLTTISTCHSRTPKALSTFSIGRGSIALNEDNYFSRIFISWCCYENVRIILDQRKKP